MLLQGPVTTSLFNIVPMGKVSEKCIFLCIISHREKSVHHFVYHASYMTRVMRKCTRSRFKTLSIFGSLDSYKIFSICAIVVNLVSKWPGIRHLFRKYILLLIGWRVFSPSQFIYHPILNPERVSFLVTHVIYVLAARPKFFPAKSFRSNYCKKMQKESNRDTEWITNKSQYKWPAFIFPGTLCAGLAYRWNFTDMPTLICHDRYNSRWYRPIS